MIICLSGFVIAGTSPTSAVSNSCPPDISARYSTQHQQLLQQLAAPTSATPRAGGLGAALASGSSTSSLSNSECSSLPSLLSPPPSPLGFTRVGSCRYSRARTLYACRGRSEGELSFEPNQILTNVAPSAEPGWLRGTLHGRTGLVPVNYVELL